MTSFVLGDTCKIEDHELFELDSYNLLVVHQLPQPSLQPQFSVLSASNGRDRL